MLGRWYLALYDAAMASAAFRRHNEPFGHHPADPSSIPLAVGWPLVFLSALALYASTANRGPQWQDSGFFIVRVLTHEVINPLGLALSHPLHHWAGRLAVRVLPLEPAFAVTLVSSLAGALAVANVFGCIRTLTGRNSAALYGAISLALANTFWQLSTLAETYTLGAALLAGECWCLAAYAKRGSRWAIWGMFLFNGLGLANHLQALLTLPVLGVVVFHALLWRRLSRGGVLIGLWVWLLASLPYTVLVFGQAVHSSDPVGTMLSALFGKGYASNVLNLHLSGRVLAVAIGFPLLNFPSLLLPLAGYGLWRCRRLGTPPPAVGLLLLGLCIHAAFALRYNIPDQQTFFLPMYVILCVLGGVGIAAVGQWLSSRSRVTVQLAAVVSLQITPLLYVAAAELGRRYDVLASYGHHKPYRDDYTYLFIPWSLAERSAAEMSAQADRLATPNGLIVLEDGMARFAIRYQAIRAGRPEPQLVSPPPKSDAAAQAAYTAQIKSAVADRHPVVLVPLNRDNPRAPAPVGQWRREGDLYVLDVAAGTASPPAREAAP